MILHLLIDDKFADYAIKQFSEIDNNSHFVLVSGSTRPVLKYIKQKNKVQIVKSDSEEYTDFLNTINMYSAIISHGLFYSWQEKVILSASKKVKIAWVFWGGEIYGRDNLRKSFFAPKTRLLYWGKKVKYLLKGSVNKNKTFFVDYHLYKRIDYCLTDEHEEFKFVKKYTDTIMKELWYNYYSIEETLGELQNSTVKGNNILVGNSCSLEGNHLEVFSILNKFDLTDRKIIVPLNYGDNWLQKILLKKGTKLFAEKFFPLIDFLERDVYNEYLTTCNVVVMNHYRPQAQGNIITSLWLGAKVYLSNKSIAYNYFKRLGICFFSIEDDLISNNKFALESLSADKVEHNRRILMSEYGRDNMQAKIRKIVEELN